MNNLAFKSDDQLLELLKQSRQTLTAMAQMLEDRPDMDHAVRRLMAPEANLVTFNRLAENDPVLMGRVLQASVVALVNVQSMEAVEGELKRRAVKEN